MFYGENDHRLYMYDRCIDGRRWFNIWDRAVKACNQMCVALYDGVEYICDEDGNVTEFPFVAENDEWTRDAVAMVWSHCPIDGSQVEIWPAE